MPASIEMPRMHLPVWKFIATIALSLLWIIGSAQTGLAAGQNESTGKLVSAGVPLEIDSVVILYGSGSAKSMLESATFGTGSDQPGNLKLGLSRRHSLSGTTSDSPLFGTETGWTLSGDINGPESEGQGIPLFTVTPRTGLLFREIPTSPENTNQSAGQTSHLQSQWLGASLSFWRGQQTSRWSIDFQKTFADDQALDVTDVDGKRILTPDRIDGNTVGIGVLHLAAPDFLWKGNLQFARSTNRPDAAIVTAETRYFLSRMGAAIHGQIATYDNLGSPEPVTMTGELHSRSFQGSWHQKVGERLIVTPIYRWQHETEIPRAENGTTKTTGSDQITLNLRYRLWNDYWLEDASEVVFTTGLYRTNIPADVWFVGIGYSSR